MSAHSKSPDQDPCAPAPTPRHPGLGEVNRRIRQALADAGREDGSVQLVAVSKTFDAGDILPVIAAGQKVFGENRVQEASGKWPALKARFPDIVLHLIGPLQSNKAKQAVALFDVIETVDRPKIARALAEEMAAQNKHPELFVQVNTGAESQKSGILPDEADEFIAYCRNELGLEISGLMCIPPVDEEPSLHFALLDEIAERNRIAKRSMGMSADFDTAIMFGATHVRVGSAIFGHRERQIAG